MSFLNRPGGPLRRFAWLLFILIIAAGLRIYRLGANGLWLDEFFSLECSSGWSRTDWQLRDSHNGLHAPAPDLVSLRDARPWWTIWSSMGSDENHPPLYFMLLRSWRQMFGDSEVALRSFSVTASVVAIVLLYCIGVTIDRPKAALWACALMALAWPQIQLSHEARAYAFVTTVALACALALVRIERFGLTRGRLIALFTTALALPLLHYMSLATLAAMILYVAVTWRGAARRQVLVCFSAGLLVFAASWGPHVVAQRHRMIDGTTWLADQGSSGFANTVQRLTAAPARLLIEPDDRSFLIASIGAVALIVPLLLLRRRPQLLLWWLWLVVPIAVALTIDLCIGRASLAIVKYFLAAAPALYLMCGMLASAAPRFGWIAPATAALSCALCLPNVYDSDRPEWRTLAGFVRTNTSPGEPVLLVDHRPGDSGPFWLLGLSYYLGEDRPIFIVDAIPPTAQLATTGASHVCVVGNSSDIEHLCAPAGGRVEHEDFVPRLAYVGAFTLPRQGIRTAALPDRH